MIAAPPPSLPPEHTPVTRQCVHDTATRFALPVRLLLAILAVENGKVGHINQNTNGTYDIGPMQINSIWLPRFTPYVSARAIRYNGCINVQVGAWILRHAINSVAGDFWQGVGRYHSKTPHLNQNYQAKVYRASLTIK